MKSARVLGLLLALSILSTACGTSGEDLQGRFGETTPGVLDESATLSLSSSSSSGSRTVSSSDVFMNFELSDVGMKYLYKGDRFRVQLNSDADFDAAQDGLVTVWLKKGTKTVGSGVFNLTSITSLDEVIAFVEITAPVLLTDSGTTKFSLTTDTGALLTDDSGVDDVVTSNVQYFGDTVTSNIVEGNPLKY